MTETIESELVIIGAGPAGLFAAFEAAMLNLESVHLIESLDTVGGQCANLYPDKYIFDMPGHLKISGKQLAENLLQQMQQMQRTQLHLNTTVTNLIQEPDGWLRLETNRNQQFHTRSLIIAGGVGGFTPQKPNVERLEEFEGHSVFYKVNELEQFRGQRVLIAGGGDSAVDWAMALLDVAQWVGIVHRRTEFRCSPANAERIQQLAASGSLHLYTPCQLQTLQGNQGQLESVTLTSLEDTSISTAVPVDALIVLFGLVMNLGKMADWGLTLDKNRIVVTPLTMATNIPGVFAIGDITSYEHKIKLVHVSCTEASWAVRSVHQYLYPDRKLGEIHSSNLLAHV